MRDKFSSSQCFSSTILELLPFFGEKKNLATFIDYLRQLVLKLRRDFYEWNCTSILFAFYFIRLSGFSHLSFSCQCYTYTHVRKTIFSTIFILFLFFLFQYSLLLFMKYFDKRRFSFSFFFYLPLSISLLYLFILYDLVYTFRNFIRVNWWGRLKQAILFYITLLMRSE